MKICLVASGDYFSTYGGGQVYVKNLAGNLKLKGHEIDVISVLVTSVHEKSVTETIDENGMRVWQIKAKKRSDSSRLGEYPPLHMDILNVLEKISPDIVHANGWKRVTSHVSRILSIPCIVTAHHGGIVCPAGALLNSVDQICKIPASQQDCLPCCVRDVPGHIFWYPLLNIIPLGLRLVLGDLVRNWPFIPFVIPLIQMSMRIQTKLEEVNDIGRLSTVIIAPSPAIRNALIRNGMPEEKIKLVTHGISLPGTHDITRHIAHRPLRLIFVGRITYVKGLHVLFDACKGLEKGLYELHVVGNAVTSAERRYLSMLKKEYPMVNLIWHGWKNSEDVSQLLTESDVMVHPAICLEVFGLTIAESLAWGCPVIATRCGGPEIQINDGVNGMLVEANDAASFRQALQMLLHEPELVEKMSRQCKLAKPIESHVDELVALYQSLINSTTEDN